MVPTAAILLVAGVGSRLRPLTDDRPKCLVSLGRETVLARAVRILHACGIGRLILSTGYMAPALHAALADAPLPVSFVHNPDYDATQNVVSLARAVAVLGPDEPWLKLDGDVVFTAALLRGFLARPGGAVVAVERAHALGAEEMKVAVADGRITAFGKGLEPARCYGESIGLERFDAATGRRVAAAVSRAVAAGRTGVYYEDVYNDVLDDPAAPFVPHDVDATGWTEIDDLADLERARGRFATDRETWPH